MNIINKFSEKKTKYFIGFLFLLVITFFWSWRNSGIIIMTTNFSGYPFGFIYLFTHETLDKWPILKENIYYINQFLSFVGTKDVYVNLGSGFEMHRSLYAVFLRAMWFLGPVYAGIMLNLLFWVLAAFSLSYIFKKIHKTNSLTLVALVFVFSGQGFLYSVGEISPHVLGYSLNYFIVALALRLEVWKTETPYYNYIILFAFIGILKLAYEASWFSLPILLPISLYVFYLRSKKRQTISRFFEASIMLLPVILLALLPGLIAITLTKSILGSGKDTIGWFIYSSINIEYIYRYLFCLAEGFLSYGPILCPLFIISMILAFKNKDTLWKLYYCSVVLLFMLVTPYLMNVSGKGYITFGLSVYFFIGASYVFKRLTVPEILYGKQILYITLFLLIVYANLPLFNIYLPLRGYVEGYMTWLNLGNWYYYDIYTFQ